MKTYSLDDFAKIQSAKELVSGTIDYNTLPSVEEVKALASWTAPMLDLFNVTKETAMEPAPVDGQKGFDRSGALARMAYYGAEQAWSNEQIMAVLLELDTRWEKYATRNDREHRYLLPMIDRARAKHGYEGSIDIDVSRLLSGKDSASTDEEEAKLVYGLQEFVDADFKVDWILEGLLAQNGIGLVVGDPGTGKTQACIQMGATLALGLDKFLKWDNIGGAKKVLFLSMEMSAPSLNLFMGQIVRSYEDRNTLNRNFLVAPLGQPIPLDKPEGQAFLNNLLDEFMPDVIFIDSLQRAVSKEMTDELAVKALFHYLAVTRKKYNCSMVIVHHNRKKPNDAGKKVEADISDVYGSYIVTADVDFILSLKKQKEAPNLLVTDTLKQRLGAETPAFEMVRDENLMFSIDFEAIQRQFAARGLDGDEPRGISLGI